MARADKRHLEKIEREENHHSQIVNIEKEKLLIDQKKIPLQVKQFERLDVASAAHTPPYHTLYNYKYNYHYSTNASLVQHPIILAKTIITTPMPH